MRGRQVAAENMRTRADESERGNKRDELARQAIAYARTLVFHSAELLAVAKRIVTVKEEEEEEEGEEARWRRQDSRRHAARETTSEFVDDANDARSHLDVRGSLKSTDPRNLI